MNRIVIGFHINLVDKNITCFKFSTEDEVIQWCKYQPDNYIKRDYRVFTHEVHFIEFCVLEMKVSIDNACKLLKKLNKEHERNCNFEEKNK